MIDKSTKYGNINFSEEVVAQTAGGAATECIGVVGMASKKMLKDGVYELLKKDNYTKGIVVKDGETGLVVDMYIFVGYGMKISEVVLEVQKRVKYVLEQTLEVQVEAINVYVQGIKVV